METIITHDGKLCFYPDFFATEEASYWFDILLDDLDWTEETIKMFGKPILVPRLVCWYGDKSAIYQYSGIKHIPLPWTKSLTDIKHKIEAVSQHPFNSVLGNLYRSENDSMGWHSDNEKELGSEPFIASLSLGEERIFKIKHRTGKEQHKLTLPSGSLLTMSGSFQHHWQHCVPKSRSPKQPRINLTFRYVHT
ncbi:alpha-ketoglutarate-dependent dioxygenase AlkB family protein [Kaarinaea lacus]